MKFILSTLGVIALVLSIVFSDNAIADEHGASGAFQIVKATESRVWRLNKNTGEISVCTLDGENLICTTSSEAVQPPGMSYEEWQAAKSAEAAQIEQEKEAKQAEDRAFFLKILDMIKTLVSESP